MNKLSELINNGVYPKRLKVTRSEAVPITQHFQTAWRGEDHRAYEFTDNIYTLGHFRAYYNTRTGKQKHCVIYFYED